MFACARICVEVDLEKGLLEAVLLMLDNWIRLYLVDYEQQLFKCKTYHEYDHFAKNCKLNQQAHHFDKDKEE